MLAEYREWRRRRRAEKRDKLSPAEVVEVRRLLDFYSEARNAELSAELEPERNPFMRLLDRKEE